MINSVGYKLANNHRFFYVGFNLFANMQSLEVYLVPVIISTLFHVNIMTVTCIAYVITGGSKLNKNTRGRWMGYYNRKLKFIKHDLIRGNWIVFDMYRTQRYKSQDIKFDCTLL